MVLPGLVARKKSTKRVDEVEVWRSVVDSWKRMQRAAEKNLATTAELSIAEIRILRVLREEGSSPMKRFCSETMLSQPTITGIVDKLVERGLVERVSNREDRREVIIAITDKGTASLAKGEELHRRFVERSLSALQDDDLAVLNRLLKTLADSSDSQPPVTG